jgi:hypothetical protein
MCIPLEISNQGRLTYIVSLLFNLVALVSADTSVNVLDLDVE